MIFMKIAALLLCAGHGSRFNSPIPKQFHLLNGKKIYRHPLDTLIFSNLFSEIAIVTQKSYFPYLDYHPTCRVIEGGTTRQDSVSLGLQGLNADSVIVCEGARPFLTLELLQAHIDQLLLGAVGVNTCIPCTDTINIHKNGVIHEIPDRNQFFHGQTPQSFCTKILIDAHLKATKTYTDDCSLLLDRGFSVAHVLGSEKNIKITTAHDLEIAKMIASFPCNSEHFSV